MLYILSTTISKLSSGGSGLGLGYTRVRASLQVNVRQWLGLGLALGLLGLADAIHTASFARSCVYSQTR